MASNSVPQRVAAVTTRLWPFNMPVRSIYVAASLFERDVALQFSYKLLKAGFQVTSCWIEAEPFNGPKPNVPKLGGLSGEIEWNNWAKFCIARCDENLSDIERADAVVILTGSDSSAGGRHVELGYALAAGKNILLVGKRENVFAFHDSIRLAATPNEAYAFLVAEQDREQHQRKVEQSLFTDAEIANARPEKERMYCVRDVYEFMQKFRCKEDIEITPGGKLPDDVRAFRVKFLHEELHEYRDAVSGTLDTAKALDSLVDLVYVAVGNAIFHNFDLNSGWYVQHRHNCIERARDLPCAISGASKKLATAFSQISSPNLLATNQFAGAWLENVARQEALLGDNLESYRGSTKHSLTTLAYSREIKRLQNCILIYEKGSSKKDYDKDLAHIALVNLIYSALRLALIHDFPFAQAWNLVHAANMKKVRVTSAEDSEASTGRGSKYDVKKPKEWQSPDIEGLLKSVVTQQGETCQITI